MGQNRPVITHVVLFALPDGSDRDAVIQRLGALWGKVPTLGSLKVGAEVVDPARPNQVALVTTFDSVADLESYQAHPVHRELVDWMNERGIRRSVVDFEG